MQTSSLQELWADKGRTESRFNFRPAVQDVERGRDGLEGFSLGRDSSLASSAGRANGMASRNSLSSTFSAPHNTGYLPQERALGGQSFMPGNYQGQQVDSSLKTEEAASSSYRNMALNQFLCMSRKNSSCEPNLQLKLCHKF